MGLATWLAQAVNNKRTGTTTGTTGTAPPPPTNIVSADKLEGLQFSHIGGELVLRQMAEGNTLANEENLHQWVKYSGVRIEIDGAFNNSVRLRMYLQIDDQDVLQISNLVVSNGDSIQWRDTDMAVAQYVTVSPA